jgi:hypothetical protein
MSEVSLEEVFHELKDLKKEVAIIRRALIPEEHVSKRELAELDRIRKRMVNGERVRLEEAL